VQLLFSRPITPENNLLLNPVLFLLMPFSVIIAGNTVTKRRPAKRKPAPKRIKSGRLPAVHQNMFPTSPLANNRSFRVVSAKPKTTELTNVLECQRFANALQIPTARNR
jgi:hypothetical protein